MKIVVTGPNGFIGKNLVVELSRRFVNSNIYCLVRNHKNHINKLVGYFKVAFWMRLSCKNVRRIAQMWEIR